jgi:hypothetical protein
MRRQPFSARQPHRIVSSQPGDAHAVERGPQSFTALEQRHDLRQYFTAADRHFHQARCYLPTDTRN